MTAIDAPQRPAPRRSPNRQRLMARIALWTVVFPVAGLLIPRLFF